MSEQRETPAPATESVETAQTNGAASVPAPVPAPVPAKVPASPAAPAVPTVPTAAPTVPTAAPTVPTAAPTVPTASPVAPVAPTTPAAPKAAPAAPKVPIVPTVPTQMATSNGNGEPIRARISPATVNGQQASANSQAAIQRGLELLAETEASQANEEIKKLDAQLDYFNKYLDKYEKRSTETTERVTQLLQQQKEERMKRRASFQQKEEEMKAQQDSFDNQLRNMFAKCAQMRRQSAPVMDNGVSDVLENSRRIREGAAQEPIYEANGHEEAEAAPAATTN